jgi:hypothetical protein
MFFHPAMVKESKTHTSWESFGTKSHTPTKKKKKDLALIARKYKAKIISKLLGL